MSGCYAFQYGEWPEGMAAAGAPNPEALPSVIELRTERVGETDEVSVDGRIHEVRTHGRPGRGILHYWRMVNADSVVVWTGGPVGFVLNLGVDRRSAVGTATALTEQSDGQLSASVQGTRAPCPRQTVPD